jgi:hypothetical protein
MGIEHAGETFKGMKIPKRTPSHPTKSHAVLVGSRDDPRLIRFGEQGAKTNQNAKQRKSFKARHRKNIAKGESSAAYWANKVKW